MALPLVLSVTWHKVHMVQIFKRVEDEEEEEVVVEEEELSVIVVTSE
jgi:hypothetical protein